MKKIFYITLLIWALFGRSLVSAQQLPSYSEYMFDKSVINSAYTGTTPYIMGTGCFRTQYTGLPGNPQTQFLTFQAPIQRKNIGLGFRSVNDRVGPIKNTKFSLLFSYSIGLGKGKLSFGIDGGVVNQVINFTDLVRKDAIDDALTMDKQSKLIPDAGFSMYYQTKSFFAGWSSMQLLKTKINYTNYNRNPVYRLWNHNFFVLGGNLSLGKQLRFEPSMLLKQVAAAPMQIDLNARFLVKNMVGLSASYRTSDAFCIMGDVLIKEQFRIGFSYDITTSSLSKYTGNSMEVMLTYRKKLLPPAKDKEMHPRYYIY